jgi:hypothetical protein
VSGEQPRGLSALGKPKASGNLWPPDAFNLFLHLSIWLELLAQRLNCCENSRAMGGNILDVPLLHDVSMR